MKCHTLRGQPWSPPPDARYLPDDSRRRGVEGPGRRWKSPGPQVDGIQPIRPTVTARGGSRLIRAPAPVILPPVSPPGAPGRGIR